MNDVTKVLMRILPIFTQDVESYAECCSMGGTGRIEDMEAEDAEIVFNNRFLIGQARKALEAEGVLFDDS